MKIQSDNKLWKLFVNKIQMEEQVVFFVIFWVVDSLITMQ